MASLSVAGPKEMWVFGANPEWIRDVILKAGNKIGAVKFIKRTDNSLRSMSYRLNVKNPTAAQVPKGERVGPYGHNQITVLDTNKVVRNEKNEVVGRGAWRTIPLENVKEISVSGTKYIIKSVKL